MEISTLIPTIVLVVIAVVAVVAILKTATVVPQQEAYIVERLGKYHRTLLAGFHVLIPFIDRVAYKINLKEEPIDVPAQTCITKDNVALEIDGVLYLKVFDPKKAAYGVEDYQFAAIQLAQTSLRSAIGKIDLDRTFEERENLNAEVVQAVDEAAQNWGVKVLRYEIKDIRPPESILQAMEKQMKAEREKRAMILESEGQKTAQINLAEAEKERARLESEGEKLRKINEAEGQAQAILKVAEATAEALRVVAEQLEKEGGEKAAQLEVAKKWVEQFGHIAKESTTLVVPQDLADTSKIVASAFKVFESVKQR